MACTCSCMNSLKEAEFFEGFGTHHRTVDMGWTDTNFPSEVEHLLILERFFFVKWMEMERADQQTFRLK